MGFLTRLFAAEPDTSSSNWILATREMRRRRLDTRDRTYSVVLEALTE